MDPRHFALDWTKSSYSGNGACVETAQTEQSVLVRDSKKSGGPILSFALSSWEDFVAAVRAGEIHAG
jgi:predicted secreted Zn-dependent protease